MSSRSRKYDVLVIGSGFTGAILAWLLARGGRRVLMVDRLRHPRFAVGESSTPLADTLLERLGRAYDVPELVQLARYGSWKQHHGDLTCGKKRGFSYYVHRPGVGFDDSPQHDGSLLVAASADDAVSDTHWLRSEVDAYLAKQAAAAGVEVRLGREAVQLERHDCWRVRLRPVDEPDASSEPVNAAFVVDASGGGLAMGLPVCDATATLRTRTSACFGHVVGLPSWSAAVGAPADDPFDADDAAQHHLLPDGWLWMLRFDDGRTSVGRVWRGWRADFHVAAGANPAVALDAAHAGLLSEHLRSSQVVAPEHGWGTAGRLQRFLRPAAGSTWALLPTAAATIDPLHSTGIAHGLSGVARLAEILLAGASGQAERLQRYALQVEREVRFLDRMVSLAYRSWSDFRRFTVATMLYFVAAIDSEERLQAGADAAAVWSTDCESLQAAVARAADRLEREPATGVREATWDAIADRVAPWNRAGLLDQRFANRYRYTATKA